MKPNEKQDSGPEREGERQTEGGSSESESRPESEGVDTAQRDRLEKEREIGEGGTAGAESTDPGVDVEDDG